jgi:hypothetical protein
LALVGNVARHARQEFIRQDLAATAYINELQFTARAEINRGVKAGEPILVRDVERITSIDLGVEVPDDCAIVLLRSNGWRRSLFYDYGPLHNGAVRDYRLDEVLAQQAMLLIGLLPGTDVVNEPDRMAEGVERLRTLLDTECAQEARYQELLQGHPWMLGGIYSAVSRHEALDDRAVPDFTATRCYDSCHDIIELKQPFLELFRQNGDLSNNFNDAWNQAERYLDFAERQHQYLREERDIRIANPRCLLIAGHGLSEERRSTIRRRERRSTSVQVITYNELLLLAENVLNVVRAAGVRPYE